MGLIKLALVKFTSDKCKKIVNVSDIDDFRPRNKSDFFTGEVYDVFWDVIPNDGSDRTRETYPAHILCLGETLNALKKNAQDAKIRNIGDLFNLQAGEEPVVRSEQPTETAQNATESAVSKRQRKRLIQDESKRRILLTLNGTSDGKCRKSERSATSSKRDCSRSTNRESRRRERSPKRSPWKITANSEVTEQRSSQSIINSDKYSPVIPGSNCNLNSSPSHISRAASTEDDLRQLKQKMSPQKSSSFNLKLTEIDMFSSRLQESDGEENIRQQQQTVGLHHHAGQERRDDLPHRSEIKASKKSECSAHNSHDSSETSLQSSNSIDSLRSVSKETRDVDGLIIPSTSNKREGSFHKSKHSPVLQSNGSRLDKRQENVKEVNSSRKKSPQRSSSFNLHPSMQTIRENIRDNTVLSRVSQFYSKSNEGGQNLFSFEHASRKQKAGLDLEFSRKKSPLKSRSDLNSSANDNGREDKNDKKGKNSSSGKSNERRKRSPSKSSQSDMISTANDNGREDQNEKISRSRSLGKSNERCKRSPLKSSRFDLSSSANGNGCEDSTERFSRSSYSWGKSNERPNRSHSKSSRSDLNCTADDNGREDKNEKISRSRSLGKSNERFRHSRSPTKVNEEHSKYVMPISPPSSSNRQGNKRLDNSAKRHRSSSNSQSRSGSGKKKVKVQGYMELGHMIHGDLTGTAPLKRNGNGEVHIGNGVWISEDNWTQRYSVMTKLTIVTRELMTEVWGQNDMAKRSIAGVACPTNKNRLVKSKATPAKLNAILGCSVGRLMAKNITDADVIEHSIKGLRTTAQWSGSRT